MRRDQAGFLGILGAERDAPPAQGRPDLQVRAGAAGVEVLGVAGAAAEGERLAVDNGAEGAVAADVLKGQPNAHVSFFLMGVYFANVPRRDCSRPFRSAC